MAVVEERQDGAVLVGGRARRRARRAREVALGSPQRLGLWILPLFLVAALIGATLAGGVAVLYYAQQLSRLEATTAEARAELDVAKASVDRTATEARSAIEAQAEEVQQRLAAKAPVDVPSRAGIYGVSATHADGEVRVGSAFTVFSDKRETFFVTNYRLVRTDDDWMVELVELFLPHRRVRVRVHSFDAERDLAVLVARGGPLPVLEWRGPDQPVARGDTVYLAGVAGADTAAVLPGTIGGVNDDVLIPVLPFNAFLAGGPLLDGAGKVVAIASLDYAPFGRVRGDLTYAVPIRAVCIRLIRCTRADVGAAGLEDPPPSPLPPAPPTPAPADGATTADPVPGGAAEPGGDSAPASEAAAPAASGEEPGPSAP